MVKWLYVYICMRMKSANTKICSTCVHICQYFYILRQQYMNTKEQQHNVVTTVEVCISALQSTGCQKLTDLICTWDLYQSRTLAHFPFCEIRIGLYLAFYVSISRNKFKNCFRAWYCLKKCRQGSIYKINILFNKISLRYHIFSDLKFFIFFCMQKLTKFYFTLMII